MTETLKIEPPEAADSALARVDLADLMTRDWPPARYVFEPIIPRREVTLLGGHGGIGKSMLGLTLAAHAACGRRWGPFPATQCPAVYLSLEDEAAIVLYRLRRIVEHYALPSEGITHALTVFDGSGGDATLAAEVMDDGIRRLVPTVGMDRVEATAAGAGLIVIDNASDAFAGNENERRQVRAFIRMLTGIARTNDAGLLLLAHVDKNAAKYGSNGNAYSGSTAWHNSARSRLALTKDEVGISLEHQKANFSTQAAPVPLAFAEHGVLAPQSARADNSQVEAKADADAILKVLTAAWAADITVPTAATGPATAWNALADLPELGAEYRTHSGKRRVSAALVRLTRDGRISKVSYRNDNRKLKERFELAQNNTKPASTGAPLQSPYTPARTGARAKALHQSRTGAPIQTGAELARSPDWLDGADPAIRATLRGLRK
jgi:RecA-family ATPase